MGKGFPSKGQANRYAMRKAHQQWRRETRQGSGGGDGGNRNNAGCMTVVFIIAIIGIVIALLWRLADYLEGVFM